jgi:peptidoglycan/xylan/chitin deacetylase (PgdA/CDA1 family)
MIHDEYLPQKLTKLIHDDSLTIFLFHGVINKQSDRIRNYTKKHIEKDLFVKCIKSLSSVGNPLSMDEVLYNLENKIPFSNKSFAITFDDGFENNLSVAMPILDDYNIPATIYVTSDFIENNHMSWIDRIELAVQNLNANSYKLKWADQTFTLDSDKSKIDFLNRIRQYVKNETSCNANEYADDLCYSLDKQTIIKSNDPLDLKMTWDQVKGLHKHKLFSIGGHSHKHVILSFLSETELANELDTSLKMLNDKAQIPPTHYSYPEGLSHCYNKLVIDELKKREVRCCPTAIYGFNKESTDSFELKRIMVS